MRSPFASHRCVTLITRQTDEDSLPLPPGDQGGFLKRRLKQQVLAQVLQACKWQCPGGSFFLTAALEKTGAQASHSGLERSLEPAGEEVFGNAGRSLAYFSPH